MAYNKGDNNASRRRPMRRRKKVCAFCADKEHDYIDYKDVNKLKRYVSERGKILPRRITGNCAKHQRALTVAVKRARHVAIMPYTTDLFWLVYRSDHYELLRYAEALFFLFFDHNIYQRCAASLAR